MSLARLALAPPSRLTLAAAQHARLMAGRASRPMLVCLTLVCLTLVCLTLVCLTLVCPTLGYLTLGCLMLGSLMLGCLMLGSKPVEGMKWAVGATPRVVARRRS